jgi:hypothetical protein
MPSAEYDLWYMRDGIDQLENYLLSKDIYWPVGVAPPAGEAPYPQFTLGNLLLSQQRARATAQTPNQRAEFNRLNAEMGTIRTRWRVALAKKAEAEFHARLMLWRDFLEEYRKNPSANHDRYAYEVNRRVLLELLQREAYDLPADEIELLDGLDRLLKSLLASDGFIWEPELIPAFSVDRFWYLYGYLPKALASPTPTQSPLRT